MESKKSREKTPAEDLNIRVGTRLRERRKELTYSTETVANMVGLSVQFIGLIERGTRGTQLVNLVKICDVLGITIDQLVKAPDGSITDGEGYSFAESDESKLSLSSKHEKIQTLIKYLEEPYLDIVINTIEGLVVENRKVVARLTGTASDEEL